MSGRTYRAPRLELAWRFADDLGADDAPRLLALLRAIADSGSIAAAARQQASSYRHAWGRIERWQSLLGRALVESGRGSGSRPTAFARELLDLDAELRVRMADELARAEGRMAALLAARERNLACPMDLRASHDLALAGLPPLLLARGQPAELHFCGSLDALAALAAGRCDAAGFHCPDDALGRRIWSQYRRHLSPRKHALVRVCERVQGLMVSRGNPKRIHGLSDLARRRVRFLNRQPGAGTRLVLDLMLREQGLDASDIRGYASEEHTHAAVAALIAGGEADAALGIEAAARRFGLDFVPLVRETYYFAYARKTAHGAAILALTGTLASKQFRRQGAALAGYDLSRSGETLTVAELDLRYAADRPA